MVAGVPSCLPSTLRNPSILPQYGLRFLWFMVLWFCGFTVLWFHGFMVSWFYNFMVLWFYGFKKYKVSISCFLVDIDLISKILKISLRGFFPNQACLGVLTVGKRGRIALLGAAVPRHRGAGQMVPPVSGPQFPPKCFSVSGPSVSGPQFPPKNALGGLRLSSECKQIAEKCA